MIDKLVFLAMDLKIYNNILDFFIKKNIFKSFCEKMKDKEAMSEFARYIFIGVLTTFCAFFTLWIFFDLLNFEKNLSNILSNVITIIFAYFTNRIYVFKSTEANVGKESIKFFISRIITFLIDAFLFFLLTKFLISNIYITKIFTNIIVVILNYIFSKLFVFKNKKDKTDN